MGSNSSIVLLALLRREVVVVGVPTRYHMAFIGIIIIDPTP